MGRRKKPFITNVEITDIGAEGKAIAKVNGKILFVPMCIPGDIADIQVNRMRKNYMEGYVVEYKKHSENREEPFCEHFGICGGCKWQHLPYVDQLKYKEKQVNDHFERIGKITGYERLSIYPSKDIKFYRNKLEFTFSDSRWMTKEELDSGKEITERNALGFHIPQRFEKILDLKNCYLQKEPSEKIRKEIRKYAINNDYSFFNVLKEEGLLRHLIIRTSEAGETMVIVSFFYDDKIKRIKLLEYIQCTFPEITSVYYVINSKKNDILYDLDIELYSGKDHIIDKLDGLKFKIGPKSFYQTNSIQAENLYKIVKDFCEPDKKDIIYDLYTGTGTIAIFLARFCKLCIGVELIPEAIDDANQNAQINNIENTRFFSGDVKEVLQNKVLDAFQKPDIVIVDPPRNGMHSDVVECLISLKPSKIVYVSCNPATQARDIFLLKDHFELKKIQPVDMFPHTHHVENVALLTLKI